MSAQVTNPEQMAKGSRNVDSAPDKATQNISQNKDGSIAGTASARQESGIFGQTAISSRKKEVNVETPGVLVPQQEQAAKQTQTSDANKQAANSELVSKPSAASAATLARGSVQFTENAPLSLNAQSREGAAALSKADANSKPETRNEASSHAKDADRANLHEYSHSKDENVKSVAKKPESSEPAVQQNEGKSFVSNAINRVDVKEMIAQPITNRLAEGVNELSVSAENIVNAVKGSLPPEAVKAVIATAAGASNIISENISAAVANSKLIFGQATSVFEGVKNTFANADAGNAVRLLADNISAGSNNAIRSWTDAATHGLKGLIDNPVTKSTLLPGEGAKGLVGALATIAESVKQNIVGSAVGGKYIWIALAGIADVSKSGKTSGADRGTGSLEQTKNDARGAGVSVPEKGADKNKVENKREEKPSDKKADSTNTSILAPDTKIGTKPLIIQADDKKGARIIDKVPFGDKAIKPEDTRGGDKTAPLVANSVSAPGSTDKTKPVSTDGRTNLANNLNNPLDAEKTQTALTRAQHADKVNLAGSAAGTKGSIERATDTSFDIQRQSKTNWDKSLYITRFADQLILRLKNDGFFISINRELGSNFKQAVDVQHSPATDRDKAENTSLAKEEPVENEKAIKKENLDSLVPALDSSFIEISPLLEPREKEAKEKIEPKQYESQRRYKQRTNSRTRRQYSVNEGDTLEKIAEYFYADKSVAAAIYYLNRKNIPIVVYKGAEYAFVPAGTIIALPTDKQIDRLREIADSEQPGFGAIPFSSKHDELVFWESRNFVFGNLELPNGCSAPVRKVELLSYNMRIVQFELGSSEEGQIVSLQLRPGRTEQSVYQYEIRPTDFDIFSFDREGKKAKQKSGRLNSEQSCKMAWNDIHSNLQRLLSGW